MTHDEDVQGETEHGAAPKVTRRAFVGLVGAGAVAAMAGDAAAATAKSAHAHAAASPRTAAPSADIRTGIAAQKKSLAQQLDKLHAHKLAAGAWPAFGFRPLKAGRAR